MDNLLILVAKALVVFSASCLLILGVWMMGGLIVYAISETTHLESCLEGRR